MMAEHAPAERLGRLVRPNAPEAATSEKKLQKEEREGRKAERDFLEDLGKAMEKGERKACPKDSLPRAMMPTSETSSGDSLPRAAIPLEVVDDRVMTVRKETEGREREGPEDQHPEQGLTPGCSTDGLGREVATEENVESPLQ